MKKFAFVNDAAEREYKALPTSVQKDFGVSLSAIQKDETPFLTIRSWGMSIIRAESYAKNCTN